MKKKLGKRKLYKFEKKKDINSRKKTKLKSPKKENNHSSVLGPSINYINIIVIM